MPLPRLLLLVLAMALPAQASIRHAGYLLNGADQPVTGSLGLTFTLFDAATAGVDVWSASFPAVPVASGYYAVELAVPEATILSGSDLWLEVKINPATTLSPRVQIDRAPRATLASDASKLNGESAAYYLDASHLTGTLPRSTLPLATTGLDGALAAADKVKLDALDPAAIGTTLQARPVSATAPSPGEALVFTAGSPASWTPVALTFAHVSGTLSADKGGTGLSTGGTANQLLGMTSAAGGLEYKSLVAGSNVTITHGANAITIAAAAGAPSQWTTSGADIHFTTGNVAIGSTLPQFGSLFEVNGSANVNSYLYQFSSSPILYQGKTGAVGNGDTIGEIRWGAFVHNNPSAYLRAEATEGQSSTNGGTALTFSTTANGSGASTLERMRIHQNGNVGIGVPVPGQKLSVGGTIESTSGGFRFPDGTTQSTAATDSGLIAQGTVSMNSSTCFLGTGATGISAVNFLSTGSCEVVFSNANYASLQNAVLVSPRSSVAQFTVWDSYNANSVRVRSFNQAGTAVTGAFAIAVARK